MAPAPKDNSGGIRGEGNVTQGSSAASQEDTLAHVGSENMSARSEGKKRRRASSSSVQGNLSNPPGPAVAGTIRRLMGKQARKASGANPSLPEEKSDKSSREGGDLDFADGICRSLKMVYSSRKPQK
jgi:hypothetical protein